MTAFTGDVLQFHAMYDLEDIRFSCILLAHFPPKTQHTYTGSQSPTRVALKKSVLLAERSLVRHHPITTQLSICLHPAGEGRVSLVCGPGGFQNIHQRGSRSNSTTTRGPLEKKSYKAQYTRKKNSSRQEGNEKNIHRGVAVKKTRILRKR